MLLQYDGNCGHLRIVIGCAGSHPAQRTGTGRVEVGSSLPDIFVSALAEAKQKTSIPVLLPTELPLPFTNAKDATLDKGAPDQYAIVLWYELGVSNAGYAASFSGKQDPTYSPQELPNIREVRLARGITGFFRPVSCGGSCAPANL